MKPIPISSMQANEGLKTSVDAELVEPKRTRKPKDEEAQLSVFWARLVCSGPFAPERR